MSRTPRHQMALDWATAGIPVFPCVVDGKQPACPNGFHDATTNVEQIDRWWSQADYNVAFCPHSQGWSVVDLDGVEGRQAWTALQQVHPPTSQADGSHTQTYAVKTPRGGRHLYFVGELPTTAWRPGNERCLGEHIDTRGVGSYVLIPPSVVDGKPYEVLDDCDLAPVPAWCKARLAPRADTALALVSELDQPGNIQRGRNLLDNYTMRGDVAIAGRNGNTRSYQLACELYGLALSGGTVLSLIEDHWNPSCIPPWEKSDLEIIVANAANYKQNETGAHGVAPASEVFAATLDKLPTEAKKDRSRFHALDPIEQQAKQEDPVWLIPELIPDACTVLINGTKGSFKSFFIHHLLYGAAARKETMGFLPVRFGPTFYGGHEGFKAMRTIRVNALEILHDMHGRQYPFYLMPGPRIIIPAECDEFKEQIRVRLRQGSEKIAGIALDTVAKCCAGLDENSAHEMGKFVTFCDELVHEFECPVIALHHKPKDGRAVGRGSGALEAGFSTILDIIRPNPKRTAIELRVRYHKDAEETDRVFTFAGKDIAKSLVFFPTDAKEHSELAGTVEAYAPTTIGVALKELDAVGDDKAVTTTVIATHLTVLLESDSEEERQARIAATARSLKSLARTKLQGYCKLVERELRWSLPA